MGVDPSSTTGYNVNIGIACKVLDPKITKLVTKNHRLYCHKYGISYVTFTDRIDESILDKNTDYLIIDTNHTFINHTINLKNFILPNSYLMLYQKTINQIDDSYFFISNSLSIGKKFLKNLFRYNTLSELFNSYSIEMTDLLDYKGINIFPKIIKTSLQKYQEYPGIKYQTLFLDLSDHSKDTILDINKNINIKLGILN